uniref:hypothetical protein n=1 Tax=uncultured Altererythrobacter sp. TaxID=500840 RepID=UPI00261D4381|nr:hypothetical protein [uncultured Altererythrobacter sp.]
MPDLERMLKLVAGSLPLVFALAFLVPVIDQGMQKAGVAAPFDLSTLGFLLFAGRAL